MRWLLVVLVLVLASGCVTRIYDVGGFGDLALACRDGDRLCRDIESSLESRRRNIGGSCGTPNVGAYMALARHGRAAIPYLVQVFDDDDTEVAELAMQVTAEAGGEEHVIEWCGGVHDLYRLDMCRRVLSRVL
jgi:hypothetical protein